jgi:hypothetical protein
MQDSPVAQRDENGRLLPGAVINPEGNNGHNVGWQRYGLRVQKWLELPSAEIAKYADPATGEAEISKLSVIDAICVRHVLNTLAGKNVLKERHELLNRIEGKPKQTIDLTSRMAPKLDDSASPSALAEAMAILRTQG